MKNIEELLGYQGKQTAAITEPLPAWQNPPQNYY